LIAREMYQYAAMLILSRSGRAVCSRSKSTFFIPPRPLSSPPGTNFHTPSIARTAGNIILNSGGVVRGITNWGTFLLPKPTRKHQKLHQTGHYFIMRFDSSAKAQHSVRQPLSKDPRMIRYSIVKLGNTLEEIKDVAGRADWGNIAVDEPESQRNDSMIKYDLI